jgi:hypothetical protein
MNARALAVLTSLSVLGAVGPGQLLAQCPYCDYSTDCTEWYAGGAECYDDDGGCSLHGSCKTTIIFSTLWSPTLRPSTGSAVTADAPWPIPSSFWQVAVDCDGQLVVRRSGRFENVVRREDPSHVALDDD